MANPRKLLHAHHNTCITDPVLAERARALVGAALLAGATERSSTWCTPCQRVVVTRLMWRDLREHAAPLRMCTVCGAVGYSEYGVAPHQLAEWLGGKL